MPIYEYECRACQERTEFIQKFSESPKRKCPACGALKLKRLVSAAAFHLKGDGWYVTDFRDKGKKKEKDGGTDKGESKDGASSKDSGDNAKSAKSDAKSDSKSDSSTSTKSKTSKSSPSASAS